jgi:hypothetical protein
MAEAVSNYVCSTNISCFGTTYDVTSGLMTLICTDLRFQRFNNKEFERILKDEMLYFEVLVGHLIAATEQSYQISQPVMRVVGLRFQLI